ncbi:MAG: primosomal protein N' [Alphaproteobacteria bacterium]|nr:primosomal protein N' [Alphaproteobacteria bacterium]
MPERPANAEPVSVDRVSVLLPLPLAGAYDYRVTNGMRVTAGDFVRVPLGRRRLVGVVWGPDRASIADAKLKPIIETLPVPPLHDELRRFIEWVAGYTMTVPGAVLRMTMSVPDALEPPRAITGYIITDAGRAAPNSTDSHLTPQRRRVLAVAAEGGAASAGVLAHRAACGSGVIKAMVAAGLLQSVELPAALPPPPPDWHAAGPPLSSAQDVAATDLATKVRCGGFSVTLLDGVTGSGKTEVYFAAIAAALERGRQALVLLPEIALSTQLLKRFSDRFGAPPALWHSDLGHAQRRATWRHVAEGQARVVVGARSALFLPFSDLGLIVVDEEHDASFKQEEGVIYHARDMAVVRASLAHVPIVLVSATPSLESAVNAQSGRYNRLHLPVRHGTARLPEIRVVDMRKQRPERQRFLSPPLVQALGETLAGGEQAMLFLNRRGYAPLTLCRECGHRMQCPNCTAWLVEHRRAGGLQCHHCGCAMPMPAACPNCGAVGSFAACGPGVERLAEETAQRFPEARIALMASDTLTGPRAMAELLERVERHEVDVLIGTQVMAKGHHFPMLTLVGVVDADLGLSGGDLRAAERTFQLLHQVAGRAGRAARPGLVLLQTYMPEHPVMRALASDDRDGFLAAEAQSRREGNWPPFGRLAAVIVSASDADAADRVARTFARHAPRADGIEILGPAPAPLAMLRGRHRRRFLVKARRDAPLQTVLRTWLDVVKLPSGVRVQVDIDPYSFI